MMKKIKEESTNKKGRFSSFVCRFNKQLENIELGKIMDC